MINENLSTVLAIMQSESIRLTATVVVTMQTPFNFSAVVGSTVDPFTASGGASIGVTRSAGIIVVDDNNGVSGSSSALTGVVAGMGLGSGISSSSSSSNDTVIMTSTVGSVSTAVSTTVMAKTVARSSQETILQNVVIIPLYAVIFTCCVIGNLLVILTLAQNKRMRTVTNVYLLNLVSLRAKRRLLRLHLMLLDVI